MPPRLIKAPKMQHGPAKQWRQLASLDGGAGRTGGGVAPAVAREWISGLDTMCMRCYRVPGTALVVTPPCPARLHRRPAPAWPPQPPLAIAAYQGPGRGWQDLKDTKKKTVAFYSERTEVP